MDGDTAALLFVFLLAGSFQLITGLLARRKGYEFWSWFLAPSLLGLIVLSSLPFANEPGGWESEQHEKQQRGNRIGRGLAGLSLVFGLYRLGVMN